MWQWTRQRPQATTTPTSLSGQLPAGYREAVSPRSPRNTRSGALPAPRRSRNASCGAGTPRPPASSPGPAGGNRPAGHHHAAARAAAGPAARPLITQLVPARRDALQPFLRRVQLAGMGQAARCLDRPRNGCLQPRAGLHLGVAVLHLIGRGRSNSEIAAELFFGTTVKTHVTRIFTKLRPCGRAGSRARLRDGPRYASSRAQRAPAPPARGI